MNFTLTTSSPSSFSVLSHKTPSLNMSSLKLKVSCNQTPFIKRLRSIARTAIMINICASMATRLSARAEPLPPITLTESQTYSETESIESLKSLLQQKLEKGEDEESLSILKRLSIAQPEVSDWKFLMARLYGELGRTQEAREIFEEILVGNPLSFEALFENALLMDRCGEGEAVIKRLQEALDIAEDENKVKEARDVRLIMAQIQFLQKNVEEALKSYEELQKEDPSDFRPYFCMGMIYSLLDKNAEAREYFAKYRQLSPKKFEVEGFLRTPLSRMKLFGTNDDN